MAKPTALADFARTNRRKPGSSCGTCQHPRRAEIDAGLRSGIGSMLVHRWLLSLGDDSLSRNQLNHHKTGNHHEVKA